MRVPPMFAFLLVAGVAERTAAQETTGNLEGLVRARGEGPLPGVQVVVTGPSLPGSRTSPTDSDGYFRVLRLPVGTYTVQLTRIGVRELIVRDVTVHLGTTTTLGELELEPVAVQLDALVVQADQAVLDPRSTTVGAVLDASTFERLPTGRDYKSIVPLLPHANASYYGDEVNVGGATGVENIYRIDGVNVTNPGTGLGPGVGRETTLPYNFVKEIQLQTGGYEAEYGKSLGGIINVVTHSGGDEFEANAFGFFSHSALRTSERRGLLDADVRRAAAYDIGLSLGGPIARRRLWFFTAYNPRFERREIAIPGLDPENDRQTTHSFAGKLTWRAGENTDLVFTALGDPTIRRRVGPPPLPGVAPVAVENVDVALGKLTTGGVNLSLRGRTAPSQQVLLEGAVSRYASKELTRGETERGQTEPLFQDVTTGIWSGGYRPELDVRNRRTSAKLASTFFFGAHTIKVGGEYESGRTSVFWDNGDPGLIVQSGPNAFQALSVKLDQASRYRVPAVHVQDSWRVTRRLTLNAGLRWEGLYFLGAGDSVGQSINDQWQPRAGFTLQLGDLGSQKIFGAVGRFYQQLPAKLSVDGHNQGDVRGFLYDQDPRDPGVSPLVEVIIVDPEGPVQAKVEDLEGEHLDELTVGYERALGDRIRLGVHAIHRTLRAAVGVGFDPDQRFGNVGRGELSFLPEPKRDYTALGITVARAGTAKLSFLASYVLSRSWGNYTGLFASDQGVSNPNYNFSLQLSEQAVNSTGRLPNDRPHVFKLLGSYRFDFGLTAGAFFTVQSGTPLNEFGSSWAAFRPVFLVPRGSAGRTPAIWDLNLRFTYPLQRIGTGRTPGSLILDIEHIGSPRNAVWVEQVRFGGLDDEGNQIAPNPGFGKALAHQPPMTLRLGFQTSF